MKKPKVRARAGRDLRGEYNWNPRAEAGSSAKRMLMPLMARDTRVWVTHGKLPTELTEPVAHGVRLTEQEHDTLIDTIERYYSNCLGRRVKEEREEEARNNV